MLKSNVYGRPYSCSLDIPYGHAQWPDNPKRHVLFYYTYRKLAHGEVTLSTFDLQQANRHIFCRSSDFAETDNEFFLRYWEALAEQRYPLANFECVCV